MLVCSCRQDFRDCRCGAVISHLSFSSARLQFGQFGPGEEATSSSSSCWTTAGCCRLVLVLVLVLVVLVLVLVLLLLVLVLVVVVGVGSACGWQ